MIHKLLAGKGRMKKVVSLLLCLALLGSSVISSNVTAEAESDVTTVETVETSETEEETISEAVVVNEESTSQGTVSDTTVTTEETGTDVTETPAENMTEEVADEATEAVETTEGGSAETTTEQPAQEIASASESTEAVSITNTETASTVATVAEETVYTGTVTMNNSTLVTVEASAKAGTFPEDTTMSVTLLDAGDEDVENALDESGVEYDGYVSLDISFYDADGTEVEPEDGSVSVKISMDASLLGDDVDTSSLEVHHLTETSDGLEVETVADTTDVVEGTVEAADDGTVAAKFTVESFSSFTITWKGQNNTTTYFSLVIHYVTSSGSDLSGSGSDKNVNIGGNSGNSSTYTFSDYASDVSGMYSYVEARLGSTNGNVVTTATFSQSESYFGGGGNTRYLTFDDDEKTEYSYNNSTVTVNVYLIYEEVTTIDTVDSLSNGININLFDYNQSTVNNATSSAFYFGGSSGSVTTTPWNYWVSEYGAYQGIVASTLSNGYPVLAKTSATGTSLSYLFGTTNNSASTTLTGLNHLFSQEVYDATGYYEYNAATNFATIADNDDNDFTVYSSQYNPSATGASDPKFLPFNTLSSISTLGESTTNYYFGMTIDFSFIQPKDGIATWTNATTGETTSSAMVFEFTGDDDVWVFIDDVLVLDLGGIHDAVSGTIDFSTGIVTVSRLYGETSDSNTTYSLYELMEAAGKSDEWLAANFTEDENGNMIFTDYTTHTFNYYYLERGAGGSNCKIRFNLQSIPTGTISFAKSLDYTNVDYAMDIDFEFEVYVDYDGDGANYTKYTGQYEIYSTDNTSTPISTGTVSEDGNITLKHGQFARLVDSNITAQSKYYIVEVGATSDKYEVTLTGTGITDENEDTHAGDDGAATTEVLRVDDSYYITFHNSVTVENQFNLRIDKEMTGNQDEKYSMIVKIGGVLYTGEYYLFESDEDTVGEKCTAESGVITLKPGQYAIIYGLMGGSSIEVTEDTSGLSNDLYNNPTYAISGPIASSTEVTNGKAAGTALEGTALNNQDVNVIVTNSLQTTSITIKKVVKGNMGDTTKDFTFYLKDENGNSILVDGKETFTLSDGDTVTVSGITIGSTITLEEVNGAYTTTYQYGSLSGDTFTKANDVTVSVSTANGMASGDIEVSSAYNAILVTNEYDVKPDTGINLDSAPYILMLAGVAVLGGVVLFRRRRRLL